ncbi:hypothetical protein IAE16_03480 [Hydrogenobacter sp. T-2]|uniref:hypothetical protein n=1 Tax=Pampinifervens diazotrophicum TaxID=1632018 RepID=UPI002B261DD8|nr:hypothetical protein [Hydrogenobacter sp. T-2]WPM32748.1 hypothetical protein IAE16_03480 [Hydrogenobacter sp. T-2]
MNITEVVTIISAITVVVGIAVSLLNKRIDDTNNRIDELKQDMDKRFDELRQELKEEIREIRILLYKVLEVPHKKDKG